MDVDEWKMNTEGNGGINKVGWMCQYRTQVSKLVPGGLQIWTV